MTISVSSSDELIRLDSFLSSRLIQFSRSKIQKLISVYDKTGVTALATALTAMGWKILSTGGTARLLRENGVDVTDVTEVTGHPEVFNGRVKTLHPAIHAAILARGNNSDDMATLEELGYPRIDLVAVNLYPFEEVAAKEPPVSEAELIEMNE